MRRREFITGLGSATAWPAVVRAQRAGKPAVGVLNLGSPETGRERMASFLRGLAETGFVEGTSATVEYRWARGHYEQFESLTLDFVRTPVNIIAAFSTAAALAAKKATTSIPIVFLIGADPVKFGLVDAINRPGTNVTGISLLTNSLTPKRLEILRQLVPRAATVGLLVNPSNPNSPADTEDAQSAAHALGLHLLVLRANTEAEIEVEYSRLGREHADALLVSSDALFESKRDRLIELAAWHAVPSIYEYREAPFTGGLISYGPGVLEAYRQTGVYCGRILKGEKPADLPVQLATKIELVINLKTAKALGLSIPETLLATADEVIQ
jgi:putative tryptophan/tyrosine transport system substrate-binding protein